MGFSGGELREGTKDGIANEPANIPLSTHGVLTAGGVAAMSGPAQKETVGVSPNRRTLNQPKYAWKVPQVREVDEKGPLEAMQKDFTALTGSKEPLVFGADSRVLHDQAARKDLITAMQTEGSAEEKKIFNNTVRMILPTDMFPAESGNQAVATVLRELRDSQAVGNGDTILVRDQLGVPRGIVQVRFSPKSGDPILFGVFSKGSLLSRAQQISFSQQTDEPQTFKVDLERARVPDNEFPPGTFMPTDGQKRLTATMEDKKFIAQFEFDRSCYTTKRPALILNNAMATLREQQHNEWKTPVQTRDLLWENSSITNVGAMFQLREAVTGLNPDFFNAPPLVINDVHFWNGRAIQPNEQVPTEALNVILDAMEQQHTKLNFTRQTAFPIYINGELIGFCVASANAAESMTFVLSPLVTQNVPMTGYAVTITKGSGETVKLNN